MKLSYVAFITTLVSAATAVEFGELPPNYSTLGAEKSWQVFVDSVFNTWCYDTETEERILEGDTCEDGTPNGRWDPFYLTKWYGGADPALGGYPTDIDTRYPFYYGSGFFGQSGAGGNAHCSYDFDGSKNHPGKCGKIVTDHDNGPNGPGHVPPHIGLAALTRAYYSDGAVGGGDISKWFDYDQNGCRVLPSVLLTMVRAYFPRPEGGVGVVDYPPPFTVVGGCGGADGNYPYPLEYVNLVGASCTAEQEEFPTAQCYEQHSGGAIADYPPYLKPGHGSPHYCSFSGKEADVNNDWCPYLFFGPNRGKYRHPHVAYAAVETFLANKVMPDKCGATWDDNDGANYPQAPNDNSVAFPAMKKVEDFPNDPKQPSIFGGKKGNPHFIWPGAEGSKKKSVEGVFVIDKYLTPTTVGAPLAPAEPCTLENKKGTVLIADDGEEKKCGFIKKGETLHIRRERCNRASLSGEGKVHAECPTNCGLYAGLGKCKGTWLLEKGGMQICPVLVSKTKAPPSPTQPPTPGTETPLSSAPTNPPTIFDVPPTDPPTMFVEPTSTAPSESPTANESMLNSTESPTASESMLNSTESPTASESTSGNSTMGNETVLDEIEDFLRMNDEEILEMLILEDGNV